MSQAIRRFSLGRVNERQRHGVELVTQILEDYEDVAGGTALEFLLTDLMHSCNARQAPLRPWPQWAYTLADGTRIWIITEADRSSTTKRLGTHQFPALPFH